MLSFGRNGIREAKNGAPHPLRKGNAAFGKGLSVKPLGWEGFIVYMTIFVVACVFRMGTFVGDLVFDGCGHFVSHL